MEIVFQSHHASMTERMRRVEVVVQTRGRPLVVEATGRFYGPALSQALGHLESQLRRVRRPAARRVRRTARV
ncbi:MAG TPA: hypothetical protein VF981_17570 [Gemmatimonadaceae bacterium]